MSIQIKLFANIEKKISFQKEITISLENTINELKNEILNTLNWNEFNDVEINNITERVYKDYGMMFFDKGFLQKNIDNFKLNKFTIENRTFSFLVYGVKKEKNKSLPIIIPKNLFNKYKNEQQEYNINNTNQSSFKYNEEEFPPLM